MSERIRVAVLGAAGRMGSTVVQAVEAAPDLELVAALEQGRDADAAALLGAAVAAHAVVPLLGSPLDAIAPVLRSVVEQRGLVRASDLARHADLAIGVLHREVVQTLGITPEAFLAAVRFSAFVRDAVGPGPVRPQDALAVLQWYLRAGYPPREVERFTGLGHVELRRLEAGIAAALGVAA